MKRAPSFAWVRPALVAILAALPALAFVRGADKEKTGKQKENRGGTTAQAWTLEEAQLQLALHPRDAYLQYVALQLARREKKVDEVASQIERSLGNAAQEERVGRRRQVDLFSIFTGALAVQESLQLDTMAGNARRRGQPEAGPAAPGKDPKDAEREQRAVAEKRRKEVVEVGGLTGPTIKSHPWKRMLGDKKPDIPPLARCVPEDFFLAEFRSLTKMLEAMDVSDLWGTHLFNQATREARTQQTGARLKKQLGVETNPALRPFYDLVVDEVAVAGSDLFLREGSDLTLLFRFKQPEVFKARMDGFLNNVEKARSDVKRTTGNYLGVAYVHLTTPDRDVNVLAAYPRPDLHVRSNSKAAFERILEAIEGKKVDGKTVRRLGDTDEYAYIRSLMPHGAREEDGFVYLSDPFIRRLVGPQLKLTEQRRMRCYNHLRMIGHAALLYRTDHGKAPESLQTLARAECTPGVFGEGELTCPDGGKYSLSTDGTTGVCSHHGHAHYLTPCCEVPVTKVTGEEADDYKVFLEQYNQYWRTYFDPIALRLQITPQRYRLETIVLPLIDNSIYTELAKVLSGKPEPIDALPVPKRNIFSVAVRINKTDWMKDAARIEADFKSDLPGEVKGLEKELKTLNVVEFLDQGLGNQVGLHVYDAAPMFDFNLASFLGEGLGTFTGRSGTTRRGIDSEWVLFASLFVSALNSPVYVSLPVQDAKIVDEFLDRLDVLVAAGTRQMKGNVDLFGVNLDFYKLPQQKNIRGYGISFGPLKWRFFWARIGNALYIASKPFILDDLQAEWARQVDPKRAGTGPVGHAMVRIRAQNWDRVLPDYRLAWAENHREACLDNLGPLSSVSRAFTAGKAADGGPKPGRSPEELGQEVQRYADKLHTVHFFCPEGGHYEMTADGKQVLCSVHGTVLNPQQPAAPAEGSPLGKLLQSFSGMTATLTFLEDGLHAVVIIDRR